MTQSVSLNDGKKSLPLIGKNAELDIDDELNRFEAEERARLGIANDERWVETMANLVFTKREKANITMLVGGLTMAHDYLVEGALKNLGYNVLALDCPDHDALRVGKEFGNRAQCNPTYFTVGNLVKFLIHLRDVKGMSSKEVVEKFVFLTAGACGPCRFGMYVTEYRKALRDAGFEGFRVMLFQQQGGLSQASGEESGLELTPKFFLAILKALVTGDVLNALGYRIRPYEVEPGSADRAITEAKKICYDALYEGKNVLLALRRASRVLAKVEVDRTRVKPRTSVIGEFWAMTTEGDGNYRLQRFLEEEGSEVDIQLVSAWILYNIWEVHWDTRNRAELRGVDGGNFGLKDLDDYGILKRTVGLWIADKALRTAFQTFAHAGGLYGYHLPNMHEVADIAAPHYNNDLRGGEGHMEVGKLILNVVKQKATMTLSVKPFGCMPSSGVSDGVQSLITEKYPGTIFCAVETSGDGAVNFYSRVQMYMFKAKQAAEVEVEKALAATRMTRDDLRAFLARNPRYKSALHRSPHAGACTAADLIYEVAEVRNTPAWRRALRSARKAGTATGKTLSTVVRQAPAVARFVRRAGTEIAEIGVENAPSWAEGAKTALRGQVLNVLFKPPSDSSLASAAS